MLKYYMFFVRGSCKPLVNRVTHPVSGKWLVLPDQQASLLS